MSTRVTVFCRADQVDDARALAAYLDDDIGGLGTFVPGYLDADDQPCVVASGPKSDAWLARAQQPVGDRPESDTEQAINMTGAARALAATVFWRPSDPEGEPNPLPDWDGSQIIAIVGVPPDAALSAMAALGVEKAPQD
ncbi:hypothetical protein [Roseicitreum antarcticum]|uniref:Uncharacterized protein n=1 Tax=Roseicitreum antarcticum TaxID=564137 RepID=A0A1H2WDV1_9RHOB|nr:hypothetical protein [Roseicitreum antarcticum]SDW78715.1 hypothetical protein SAMN04488238_103350 [Roseicitreum antarcticum]